MEKILNLLRETGAMLEGHFLLSSGKHSNRYFQCAKLLQHPNIAKDALKDIAEKIRVDIKSGKLKVDLVAGPALGGIIPAYELARQLELPAIFTERGDNGIMVLRRGFEIPKNANVLIAEDVITTGKSSLECADALKKAGAEISGIACIVDRRSELEITSLPFYCAVKVSVSNWDSQDCELCKQGAPIEKPGSRKI